MIFVGSVSKIRVTYQKVLWTHSYGWKNLLNFTCQHYVWNHPTVIILIKGDYGNENCHCNQIEGECNIDENNFISASLAKSDFECWLQCSINAQCKFYTWFSSENDDVSNECILFSSCQTINECNGGCYIGGVDCHQPTTIPRGKWNHRFENS